MTKNLKKDLLYFGLSIFTAIVLLLLLNIPLFEKINNIYSDSLQGEIAARDEIVIVGIDDSSLREIGSWPWDRITFANAIENIKAQKPASIGFDILFLENRRDDSAFLESTNNSDIPIVLGSKLADNQVLKSIFESETIKSGFVNFPTDSDGIIRKTKVFTKVDGKCEPSFALSLAIQYFQISDQDICNNPLKLRNNSYELSGDNEIRFSYTNDDFNYISFKDVLNNNFEEEFFKDKIVLIGSTALDLRLELNDNFTSVFGETIPGVQIHANILNSFLENSFYHIPSTSVNYFIYLLLFLILTTFSYKIKKNKYDLIFFAFIEIVVFIASIIGANFGQLLNFVQLVIFVLGIYIFNLAFKYLTQSRENRFVKTVFSRYLSPKLLNVLLENSEKLKLGGETRNMSVLFSDIRSFTTISEGMKPAELINMINDYLSYMSTIVLNNNGTIDKYIGDAIMAFWNAPIDDEKHENNAIKTALEMIEKLKDFKNLHPNYPEINIGIGINSGEMTVGNVGGKDRFDYTVLGDNVNLGSRLEGLTKKYHVIIIVSEASMKGCSDKNIVFRFLDEVMVKGKNKSVKIYEPHFKTSEIQKIIKFYEKGLELYMKGDFKEALEVLRQNKSDAASLMLIERIETLENPPKDWNGVWKWEEK